MDIDGHSAALSILVTNMSNTDQGEVTKVVCSNVNVKHHTDDIDTSFQCV